MTRKEIVQLLSETNRVPLTKEVIECIPFAGDGQITYWDKDRPGFGLIVGKRSKTFLVQVDVKDPSKPKGYRTVRKTLGRYGEMTIEQARKEMAGYDDKDKGFVPGKRLEIKRGKVTANGSNVTLDDMLSAYFVEKKKKDGKAFKASTVKGYTNIITRHFQTWLPLTLADTAKITPEIVIDRFQQAETNHGPFGARNAFVMLTAIINYALVKYPGAITTNPLNVLRIGNHMKKIEARTEQLKGNDFHTFHEGIQKFNEIIRDAYLVCLYHGMRSEEASGLRWEHVNLDNQTISIPDTKNRETLYVPLCRQSLAILTRRRDQNPEGIEWVFPSIPKLFHHSTNKTGHVRLMAAALKLNTKLDITVHGLRRTFITTARKLKIFEDADRLTNHVDSSISGRHYDGTDVDDLRLPLQTIANEIERLMLHGVGAKVIQLPTAQGE